MISYHKDYTKQTDRRRIAQPQKKGAKQPEKKIWAENFVRDRELGDYIYVRTLHAQARNALMTLIYRTCVRLAVYFQRFVQRCATARYVTPR